MDRPSDPATPETPPGRWRRLAPVALFLGPTLAAILIAMSPVILGGETFHFRDISHFHLQAKWSQMKAWSEGRLPEIDMARGGSISLGNPNTVPLYPTNLIYAVAPFYWAFNAHFWLHLLLAPLGVFWLARVFGLRRAGASAAGVVYAVSGYYLSQFGFYNLVGGAALTPALIAATVASARRVEPGFEGVRQRRWPPLIAVGALWALVLLAGDPILALEAGLLSLLVVVIDRWPRGSPADGGGGGSRGRRFVAALRGLQWLAVATILGTLIALPQYVEMARILPYSYRFQIFTPEQALLASWNPRQIAEWFLPFVFGRPQLNYWGYHFSGGDQPLFFSLFPGVLALGLALVAGRPKNRGHVFAWVCVVGGLGIVLGSLNPLLHLVVQLPGLQLLRFPIKWWLPVAVGAALLVGFGFDRCRNPDVRRTLIRVFGLLLLLYVAFAAVLVQFPDGIERWIESLFTGGQPAAREHEIRMNWLALSLVQCLLLSLYGALAWLARRAPARAGAAALAIHAASQLFLLKPLYSTDRISIYQEPPPLLAEVGEDETILHGEMDEVFGPADKRGGFPDGKAYWMQRRGRFELYPFVGVQLGRRYVLLNSPEGLGSFFTVGAVQAMRLNGDDVRVRIARTAGADVLVLKREIDDPESLGLRLRAQGSDQFGGVVTIYEVVDSPPDILLVGRIAYDERLDRILQIIMSPQFDPNTMAVAPGTTRQVDRPAGEVEILESSPQRIELVARSPEGGMLVIQRVFLSLYRATIDGEPAPTTVANLHRLGLEVPAGEHQVEIWVETAPFWRSLWASGAGLAGLCALPWLLRRRRSPFDVAPGDRAVSADEYARPGPAGPESQDERGADRLGDEPAEDQPEIDEEATEKL